MNHPNFTENMIHGDNNVWFTAALWKYLNTYRHVHLTRRIINSSYICESSVQALWRKTQDVEPMLDYGWDSVVDGGLTINRYWVCVSYLWDYDDTRLDGWRHYILNCAHADFFLYKPWKPKFFFQFKIVINAFVNSFWFIRIDAMLWVYGHCKYLVLIVRVSGLDVRIWRL